MGRPKPSDAVREFCSDFARTVTVRSQFRYDWVARIGKHSIYSALSLAARKVDSCLLTKVLSVLVSNQHLLSFVFNRHAVSTRTTA